MNLILVLLQINQPPAADPHHEYSQNPSKEAAHNGSRPASPADNYPYASAGAEYQYNGQDKMCAPRHMAKVAAEYREQSKDFDGEEGQGEDVCC